MRLLGSMLECSSGTGRFGTKRVRVQVSASLAPLAGWDGGVRVQTSALLAPIASFLEAGLDGGVRVQTSASLAPIASFLEASLDGGA